MVVSKYTLEHFVEPWKVINEVRRGLREVGLAVIGAMKRLDLGLLESPGKSLCTFLDGLLVRSQTRPVSYANPYRIVAKKRGG